MHNIEYTKSDDLLICSFSERLTAAYCNDVESSLDEAISNHSGKVAFDLEKVSYLSSSFIRFCVKFTKLLGKENFSVINISPELKKVFALVGMESLIK